MSDAPLLSVEDLKVHFPVTRGLIRRVVGQVRAVDGVSFEIGPGETLGLVGESGCGKTTVGRAVLRLLEPTAGHVHFDGKDIAALDAEVLRSLRRDLQIIFQDPFSSLNPRMRVVDIVGEALEVHGIARGHELEERVARLLKKVGLSPAWINRYPHEFSGGQRQRIGVARAIALEPKLIVCDEAVSALDVSIQAQVINLLIRLREEMGLSYLFIAHDLSVVRHISHRIAVMYLGQIVEVGDSKALFSEPGHPYTRALLSAIPVPAPRRERHRIVLAGDVPTPMNPPSGCRFHTRCPAVFDRCRTEEPWSIEVAPGRYIKCFHAADLDPSEHWHAQMDRRIESAMKAASTAAAATPAAELLRRPEDDVPEDESVDEEEITDLDSDEFVPPRTRAKVGAILLALSGLALVTGALLWGGLLWLASYLGLLRRVVGKRWDAVFLLGAVALGATSIPVERASERRAATAQLERLEQEIAAFAKLNGRPPASLSDLGWRLFPIFPDGKTVDPWGHAWRYRAPGGGERPFDLGSLGRDGAPGQDDVGNPPEPR